ncbi:nucleoside triphosphate pyrophosphohydrolase [Parvibaculum sp.]|uniref:nucleoside triphosphate pyrophosphohydrolase n=1 Tax=Parvibaculum sp. TaxID=2024848 RepID=UPI0025DD11EF|nr:nucleoside triphosphate pyrophosphohydrolase [Parvibaculum sp.]
MAADTLDLSRIDALLAIMARLRDPDGGCPWDLEQDFSTIAPYTIEEAYEVADAIEQGDMAELRDELGDLLFQVAFHARMAEEQDAFAFGDVVQAICEKMIRRHPHVFGDEEQREAGAVKGRWEEIKAQEKAAKPKKTESILDDVPLSLPGLTRAVKLQNRAARVGFDWPDTSLVIDKLNEEMLELSAEVAKGGDADRLEDEMGDLLFVYANLARHLKVDPEKALRRANAKFRRRFGRIEEKLAAQGRTPEDSNLEEMDALWDEAKAEERKP